MKNYSKNKIIFTFACFCVLFLLVAAKAIKIQLIDKDELVARSKSQIFREIKVYPKRGSIYDRNGNPLALNIQTYSIFTIPKELNGEKDSYEKLSEIVPTLSKKEILKKVRNRSRYTWIARKINLNKDQVNEIKKLKGVYIDSVPKRIYPNHEIASQLLGFVGIDNAGLAGMEYYFDEKLKGEPKVVKYIKDAKGRPVKFESRNPGSDAEDIYLSIDKDIQAVAEKTIKEAVEKHEAAGGGIGVMDVETGEVLAVANYPTFDANLLKESTVNTRKLAFVTDPFEPGSTMKSFTVASAYENKIATKETSYFCERGQFKVGDHIISEAESKKTYEWLTIDEILKYSSNIGTTKIAFDLTYPKLRQTLIDFGFGEKTNIEFPAESRGIFNPNENVSPLKLSNISFGQGIATTGIQMLKAYAAIANSGYIVEPTFLKNGNRNKEKRRIISEETAKKIQDSLVAVVENGTGGNAKIPMFEIAGKTSTAQRVDESGGYSGHIGGFIGYPVNVDKKFVIYVYVDRPEGMYYGNIVAGPVFKKVAQYLLYRNKDFSRANLADNDNHTEFDSVKVKHSAARNMGQGLMPNFVGLDKVSSQRLSQKYNIKVIDKGIGVVVKQVPAAGESIKNIETITLYYEPPSYD